MEELLFMNTLTNPLLSKWGKELNVISEACNGKFDAYRQATVAQMFENTQLHLDRVSQMQALGQMNEATQLTDVGMFKKSAINLLAAAIPNFIAYDIVSVQPMLARTSEIRTIELTYGNNKGKVKAGETVFGTLVGGNSDTHYSSDEVDQELFEVKTNKVEGNLSWLPVVPGSVKFTIEGVGDITDDGKGKLTGGGTGTVDYNTGKVVINVTTTETTATASYFYDNVTTPVKAPEVNIRIKSIPMIAKSRKLKTIYSMDASFDMMNDYGMEINNQFLATVSAQLKHEIDGEIMNDLYRSASAKAVTWDAHPRDGISLADHNESFYMTVIEAGNNIFQATKLATGSYIIAGIKASNVIESMARFRPSGIINPVGPHLVGYLGDKPVYKNPFYPEDAFLVGWKGTNLFDAGYVYAPYMPIMSTQLLMTAEFQGERGFATAYGKKTVNSNMYCKGTITNS